MPRQKVSCTFYENCYYDKGKTTRIKMISTQGYISSLRILVPPQNGLLHIGRLLTPRNFKPDLTGKDKITPVKSQREPVVWMFGCSPKETGAVTVFQEKYISGWQNCVIPHRICKSRGLRAISFFAINLRSEITNFVCSSSHKWCVTYVFVQYFCQARIFTFAFARQR